MISGSYDGSVMLWDILSGSNNVIGEHSGVVNKVAIIDPSNTGIPMIVSVGSDKVVKMWALDSLKDTLEYHNDSITSLAFLDMFFITAGFDKNIRIWSLMNHLKIKTLVKTSQDVQDLAFCNGEIIWIEQNEQIFALSGKKIEFSKRALAIAYDDMMKVLAIISENHINLYSIEKNEVFYVIDTLDTCNSVTIFNGLVVGCSDTMTYCYSEALGVITLDKGGKSIDLRNNYIIIAGQNCCLYSKDLTFIKEISYKYESVLFSRNERFLYATDANEIHLFSIPGLEKLMSISLYTCYKRFKLLSDQGIICCNKNSIIRLPEYDIEKQLMLSS